MNRFTFLFAFSVLVSSLMAQVSVPVQNVFVVHSFTGSLLEVEPHANGLILLANDGTNDQVVSSVDGVTWTTHEALENASAMNLSGWSGSNQSFYYGNNTTDGAGVDLRTLDNGSARLLWNMSGGHPVDNPAKTNVVRYDYGGTAGVRYYYLAQGGFNPMTGYSAIVYESDGTDFGTLEVSQDVGFGNNIKMTHLTEGGTLEAQEFNGALYFLAGMPATMGAYAAVFKVNYNASGSSATLLKQSENEVYGWANLTACGDYLYVMDVMQGETGSMMGINVAGESTIVSNGSNLQFQDVKPVVAGTRMFAIKEQIGSGISKLAVIDGPNDVTLLNINPESETDGVSNLVVSGDKLYFTATPTDGELTLYMLNTTTSDFIPEAVTTVNGLVGMEAFGDGYLAFVQEKYAGSYFAYVTKGVEFVQYEIYFGSGFALNSPVTDVKVSGNDFYFFENTGTEVNVWKHTLDATQFPTADVQFTIKDVVTSEVIVGASLTIDNGGFSYSGVSDASGHVTFMGIEGGTYYDYSLTASGYLDVNQTRQWIGKGASTKDLTMDEDAATNILNNKTGNMHFYPNPVEDVLHLNSPTKIKHVNIFNVSGGLVYKQSAFDITKVELNELPAGIYIVVVTDEYGHVNANKITIK
jgi:hypothetical protein